MNGQSKLNWSTGVLAVTICLVIAFSIVPKSSSASPQGLAQPQTQTPEKSDRAVVLKAMQAAGAASAPQRQAIHTDLGGIAQQLAIAFAQPNVRNVLLAQVRASQKREQMLELEQFLGPMANRPDIPASARVPDVLAAVRKTKAQVAGSGIRAGFSAQNIDLYFPVAQHRRNWQASDDLIVAAPPLDESDTTPIVAYSVRTGQPVTLDRNAPPAAPVVVVAACEHEDHERKQEQRGPGTLPPPLERRSPVGQLLDNEKTARRPGQFPGNSTIYGHYTGTKDDHEPWTSGSAEIYVVFVDYPSTKRCNVYYVDEERKTYYTKPNEVFPFDQSHSDHTYTAIWESDGGSNYLRVVQILFGQSLVERGYYVGTSDDFIEDRYWYKSSIPYNVVSDIGMGYYAWVDMQKIQ